MGSIDAVRISKTMAYLLRHKPEHGNLELDEQGFVELVALTAAVSLLLKAEVAVDRVRVVVTQAEVRRFEIVEERIRAVRAPRGGNRGDRVPDILYHATTEPRVQAAMEAGAVVGGRKPVFLSTDESQAWRVAHRMSDGPPRVLYVDAARARKHGVRFHRNRRNGLLAADAIPVRDALNLRENFAEQLSAGGFPLGVGPDGRIRLALIRVTRKSGVTWEVAKGKLEEGETPEATAVREVQEEMGFDVPMDVIRPLQTVRYGFLAPGGLPRLKTVFLYFLRPHSPPKGAFTPSEREGIGDVRWFTATEACRVVRHSSLLPVMRQVRDLIASGAVPLEGLPTLG